MSSYFYEDDEKKKLRENLLDEKAKLWAESFIRVKQLKDRGQRNPPLTSAQLRRFHMDAKDLEEKIKNIKSPEEFKKIRPMVKMLKSKVAYACPVTGRDRKVPEEFRNFIEEMVDHIEDINDFKAFALCFEAIVGYFYGQGGR